MNCISALFWDLTRISRDFCRIAWRAARFKDSFRILSGSLGILLGLIPDSYWILTRFFQDSFRILSGFFFGVCKDDLWFYQHPAGLFQASRDRWKILLWISDGLRSGFFFWLAWNKEKEEKEGGMGWVGCYETRSVSQESRILNLKHDPHRFSISAVDPSVGFSIASFWNYSDVIDWWSGVRKRWYAITTLIWARHSPFAFSVSSV